MAVAVVDDGVAALDHPLGIMSVERSAEAGDLRCPFVAIAAGCGRRPTREHERVDTGERAALANPPLGAGANLAQCLVQRRALMLDHAGEPAGELRASARRGILDDERRVAAAAGVIERKESSAAVVVRRARELERLRLALTAHDPQRTLERGYALVEDGSGEPVTNAATARRQQRLTLRMADGALPVRPES